MSIDRFTGVDPVGARWVADVVRQRTFSQIRGLERMVGREGCVRWCGVFGSRGRLSVTASR